jgi:hypothetical protein
MVEVAANAIFRELGTPLVGHVARIPCRRVN